MAVLLYGLCAIVVGLAVAGCIDLAGFLPRPGGKDPWWRGTFIGQDLVWRLVAVGGIISVAVPVLVASILVATVLTTSSSGALPTARPPVGTAITTLYDMYGNRIASFQEFATYLPVDDGDIPDVMKKAAVAAEDRRFYDHSGIDTKGIIRALWADLNGGSYVQGGSTIDQQYVRLLYGSNTKTLKRKLREAILAGRVDSQLTKDQILNGYLTRVYYGGGAYGIGAAAQLYFHTTVKKLTLSQSALLAGILPAPSDFDPRVDPAGADARRIDVLNKMKGQGLISPDQAATAINQHLTLYSPTDPPPAGATVVYPPPNTQTAYPWFVDYVRRYLTARYGVDKLLQGGLQVQTSLDPTLQSLADKTVANSLMGTADNIGMAMVVIDPQSGLVKAIVGGRDYSKSQVDAALGNCPTPGAQDAPLPVCIGGGGSGRQPGSSFKPFTLAKAFEEGISPDAIFNGPETFTYPPGSCAGPNCTVKNVESGPFGPITLREATAQSVNTVFAQLILKVGVTATAEMAHRLGVTMINANGRGASGAYGPSLTLGSADVSPLDMAAAYSVFANRGEQMPATPVIKVTAPDGTVLEDNSQRVGKRVLSQQVADEVNDVLKGVVQRGTGTAANIGRPNGTAGKTGTTQSFSDAWFVGYTPQLVTSVWMGDSTGRQPLENVKGVPQVYGGTIPAQTWHNFMMAALANAPVENFTPLNPPTCSSPTTSTPSTSTTTTTVPGLFGIPTTSTSTTISTTTTTLPTYPTLPASDLAGTTTSSSSTTLPPCPIITLPPPSFPFPTTNPTGLGATTTLFPPVGLPTTTLFPPFTTPTTSVVPGLPTTTVVP